MKNRKLISILLLLCMTLSLLFACAPAGDSATDTTTDGGNQSGTTQGGDVTTAAPIDTTVVKVGYLTGPTGIGLAKMISDDSGLYEFISYGTDTSAMALDLQSGEIDVAMLPTNYAAQLYNTTGGSVQVLALNTLGVLYVLENGDTFTNIASLAGKTVYAPAGAPTFILKYVLAKNGLSSSVTVESAADVDALAQLATAGNADIVLLPEPKATALKKQAPGFRTALDMTYEWNQVCDTDLVQGCAAVNTAFATENKAAVDRFLNDYKASIDFVSAPENLTDVSAMVVAAGILPNAAIATTAIPNCNVVCITGNEMKSTMENYLEIIHSFNANAVGGKLPDAAFYYGIE